MSGPEAEGPAQGSRPRNAWKPSIAVALTLGLSALMALVAGAVMLIGLMTAGTNTVSLLRQLSSLAIGTVEARIDQHIGAAENQAEAIARMIERGDLDPDDQERVQEALTNAMAVVPQTHGLALVRPDRPVIAVGIPKDQTEPQRFTLDIGDKAEVEALLGAARKGELKGRRDITYVAPLGQPGIIVQAPIGEGENFVGVVTSMVSVFELSSFLDGLQVTSGGRAFILYGRDSVLAHPNLTQGEPNLDGERLLPPLDTFGDPVLARIWDPPDDISEDILAGTEIRGHRIDGESDYVFLYREIFSGGTPWYLGLYLPGSETDTSYYRLVYAGTAAGGLILLSVILVFLLGRHMARPIRELAEASEAVTRLDLGERKPLRGSLFRELDAASRAHNSMTGGLKLFSTYVPQQLVLRLMRLGAEGAKLEQRDVSVMFTDISGFTRLAGELDASELATFLNRHFALQATGIDAEGGIIDKYIGDSIMAFWGAPDDQHDHAARAVRAALRISDAIAEENADREAKGLEPIGVRIGLHSGPAVVGNIGAPGRINYTLIGDTVNVAQRLEGLGREIDPDAAVILMISADVAGRLPEELKATLELESHGQRELRGRAGEIEVLRVRRRR